MTTADLCRKQGISDATFYNWKLRYGRMLALMPILVALTVWGTLAVFRNDDTVKRLGNGIAVAAMVAVPMALVGSWVVQDWAERRLFAEGYVRCGVERVGRFPALTLCARKRR